MNLIILETQENPIFNLIRENEKNNERKYFCYFLLILFINLSFKKNLIL